MQPIGMFSIDRLGILRRLTQTDVDGDLIELRYLHGVRVSELLDHRRYDVVLIFGF
jgi:hypothetical protein